jgi:hypothetical protein
LKKGAPDAIFGAVTNPLKNKHLVRWGWALAVGCATACGHKAPSSASPSPVAQPTVPLPTGGLSGQQVIVLPLTLVAAEDSLHWETALADRRATLTRADSVLGTLLKARAPEVSWVLPNDLRRAVRRAPGIATDPDQMGTAVLRVERLPLVPDPLRSQLRMLAALAGGGGGRYALVPAALVYRRVVATSVGSAVRAVGRAELAIVLADVRTGRIQWRTVATGEGDDPWTALTRAVKSLTPGLP